MKNFCVHFVVLSSFVLFAASIPAVSAPTNGSFDAGLAGWTATTGVQIVTPGILSGDGAAAQLYDPYPGTADSVSILSQTFLVDAGSSSLTFWVKTPLPVSSETDHFFVSLYDSGNNPLYNAYNDSSLGIDYLFHWDSDMAWQSSESMLPEEGGPEIVEMYETEYLLYQFYVPVSGLAGTDVTLTFTLRNHLDYEYGINPPLLLDPQIDTKILVDNVQLISDISIVPAPSSLMLAATGFISLLGLLRRTR